MCRGRHSPIALLTTSDRAAIIAASPLSNGIRWVEATDAPAGGHIAIIGPGPQGLSCAIAAIDAVTPLHLSGLPSDQNRLARAAIFGARTHVVVPGADPETSAQSLQDAGGPIDSVIEISGSPAGKVLALWAFRQMGVASLRAR